MAYTFTGGSTRIIQLSSGTTILDLKDMYSRWKDWVKDEGGSKQLCAISPLGGDPVDEGQNIYVASYFFLSNRWRIRPQEANHTLKVINGILVTTEGDSPFIQTQGSYNVLVQYSQPVQAQSTVVETGTSGLTPEESEQLSKTLTTAKFLGLK